MDSLHFKSKSRAAMLLPMQGALHTVKYLSPFVGIVTTSTYANAEWNHHHNVPRNKKEKKKNSDTIANEGD